MLTTYDRRQSYGYTKNKNIQQLMIMKHPLVVNLDSLVKGDVVVFPFPFSDLTITK
jgi:hypothetical protein